MHLFDIILRNSCHPDSNVVLREILVVSDTDPSLGIRDKPLVAVKYPVRLVGDGYNVSQLLTYMKLAGVKIGLLINFNETTLKDGLKRFVL